MNATAENNGLPETPSEEEVTVGRKRPTHEDATLIDPMILVGDRAAPAFDDESVAAVHSKAAVIAHQVQVRAWSRIEPALKKAEAWIRAQLARPEIAPRIAWVEERVRRAPKPVVLGASLGVALAFTLLIFGRSSPAPKQPAVPALSGAQIAQAARAQMAAGDVSGATKALEQAVFGAATHYGEPPVHAALASAYARTGQGPQAIPHFAIAAKSDPSTIDDSDIALLINLLNGSKKDSEQVEQILRDIGSRAVAPLKAVAQDKTASPLLKRRAKALRLGIENGSRQAAGNEQHLASRTR
jgi:hypothetical protein